MFAKGRINYMNINSIFEWGLWSAGILYLATFCSYYFAYRNDALVWQDIVAPPLSIGFWLVLAMLGYGHQSLSHLIEATFVLSLSLLSVILLIPSLKNSRTKTKALKYLTIVISLVIPFLFRILLPFISE